MLVVTLWHKPAWILFSLKWVEKISLAILTPGSAGLSNFSQKKLIWNHFLLGHSRKILFKVIPFLTEDLPKTSKNLSILNKLSEAD